MCLIKGAFVGEKSLMLEIIFEYTFNATRICVYDADETALNKFKNIAN